MVVSSSRPFHHPLLPHCPGGGVPVLAAGRSLMLTASS
jgi:hypothetical protein